MKITKLLTLLILLLILTIVLIIPIKYLCTNLKSNKTSIEVPIETKEEIDFSLDDFNLFDTFNETYYPEQYSDEFIQNNIFKDDNFILKEIYFDFENDFVFHSDNDYSNGIRLGTRFSWFDHDFDVFIGQHIYTPDSVKHPERGGSPYAGWAYAGLGYTKLYKLSSPIYYIGYYELLGGIVGKHSGAEWTQKKIHKLIGAGYPKGWENQLEDGFGFQINTRQGIEWTVWNNDLYSFHISPEVIILAGNTQDAYGVDCTAKFGYNIPLTRADNEFLARASKDKPEFSIYGLIGAEWRYWENNLFLDGDDSSQYFVDKKDNTWAVKAGIAGFYKHFGMHFIWLWGSNQYEGQRDRPDYVSMGFSYLF